MKNMVGGYLCFFQMSYRTELGKSSRGGNFQNVTLVEPYPAFQLSFVLFVCCFLVLWALFPKYVFLRLPFFLYLSLLHSWARLSSPKTMKHGGGNQTFRAGHFSTAALCGSGSPRVQRVPLSFLFSSVVPLSLQSSGISSAAFGILRNWMLFCY